MLLVNFYSVQVRYSGSFDDYTKEDFFEMAKERQNNGVDCFDYSMPFGEIGGAPLSEAYELDGAISVEDVYPCNKIALVKWSYIEE